MRESSSKVLWMRIIMIQMSQETLKRKKTKNKPKTNLLDSLCSMIFQSGKDLFLGTLKLS